MWKQPFANIIWKHQAWFGLVAVCYLFDFLPLQWLSPVLWPEPLSSSGYLKSKVPYSQPWLARCLVSPSEVFHGCVQRCQTACHQDSERGHWGRGHGQKEGAFSKRHSIRDSQSPGISLACKVPRLLLASLNGAAAPLPAQIHRILQSNFWQASEPHCFVVNFEEVFEW